MASRRGQMGNDETETERGPQYQNEETNFDLGRRDTEVALLDASARSSRRRAVERAQRRAYKLERGKRDEEDLIDASRRSKIGRVGSTRRKHSYHMKMVIESESDIGNGTEESDHFRWRMGFGKANRKKEGKLREQEVPAPTKKFTELVHMALKLEQQAKKGKSRHRSRSYSSTSESTKTEKSTSTPKSSEDDRKKKKKAPVDSFEDSYSNFENEQYEIEVQMCQRTQQLTIELEDIRQSLLAVAEFIKEKKKQAKAMTVEDLEDRDDEEDEDEDKQEQPRTSRHGGLDDDDDPQDELGIGPSIGRCPNNTSTLGSQTKPPPPTPKGNQPKDTRAAGTGGEGYSQRAGKELMPVDVGIGMDMQPVNKVTIKNVGRGPIVNEFVEELARRAIYSMGDLYSGGTTPSRLNCTLSDNVENEETHEKQEIYDDVEENIEVDISASGEKTSVPTDNIEEAKLDTEIVQFDDEDAAVQIKIDIFGISNLIEDDRLVRNF
ncbi:hypothetical protein L7F22_047584 [Adiantum nelumboides]|nr:hypothetical protein [Adiantum nelumboides]